MSSEAQKFTQLVQKIAPGGRRGRTWPLSGGISAAMTAFEIEFPDGQTKKMIMRQPGDEVLRQNPHAAQDEFRLLQALKTLHLAVPTPCLFDTSCTIFSTPYLVIEYIEGKMEFAPAVGADLAQQMAAQLASIHSVNLSNPDLFFLLQQANDFASCVGNPSIKADPSWEDGRIHATLESVRPLSARNACVLLHGDFWPGNLLWRDGQLVAVIDWEDAKIGDPLIDLAISRLDMLWIFGSDAMNSFTDHYLSLISIDTRHLPYWDLYAALRLVRMAGSDLTAWAAFFPPFARHDITEQTIQEHYCFFIHQAFQKLKVQ
jgi:aminoglycoside phosphotransferase (APT) family kinase protein